MKVIVTLEEQVPFPWELDHFLRVSVKPNLIPRELFPAPHPKSGKNALGTRLSKTRGRGRGLSVFLKNAVLGLCLGLGS